MTEHVGLLPLDTLYVLLLYPGPSSALWDFSKLAWRIDMPGQTQAPGFRQWEHI